MTEEKEEPQKEEILDDEIDATDEEVENRDDVVDEEWFIHSTE